MNPWPLSASLDADIPQHQIPPPCSLISSLSLSLQAARPSHTFVPQAPARTVASAPSAGVASAVIVLWALVAKIADSVSGHPGAGGPCRVSKVGFGVGSITLLLYLLSNGPSLPFPRQWDTELGLWKRHGCVCAVVSGIVISNSGHKGGPDASAAWATQRAPLQGVSGLPSFVSAFLLTSDAPHT